MKLPEGLKRRLTARDIPLDPAEAAQILRGEIVALGQGGGGMGLRAARRDVLSILRGVEETAGVMPKSTTGKRAERRQGKGEQIVTKPGNGAAQNAGAGAQETFKPAPRTYPGLNPALWPDQDPEAAREGAVLKRFSDGYIQKVSGKFVVYDCEGGNIGGATPPRFGFYYSYPEAARAYERWREARPADGVSATGSKFRIDGLEERLWPSQNPQTAEHGIVLLRLSNKGKVRVSTISSGNVFEVYNVSERFCSDFLSYLNAVHELDSMPESTERSRF